MKLLFSEAAPDHAHYVYPYAIWGFLEPGETPADAFAAGFLPSSLALDRFYLTRQIRIPLAEWKPTSENRRILRKAAALRVQLVPRSEFDYSADRRRNWLAYAHARFGAGVMPGERLDRILASPVITHLLHFTDRTTGQDVGTALMYLQSPRLAYYYYAFFALGPNDKSVGMEMMTQAVEHFAKAGWTHLHLGTCYTEQALYKTQFAPLEFFNGFRWSRNLEELKHLVRIPPGNQHRLETPEFLKFQPSPPLELAHGSNFQVLPTRPA